MKKIIIAAKSENNVIGKDNDLVWHMPADLKFFMGKTKGHHVIMGRKTFESIGSKPLKGRPTVVITRNRDFEADNAWVVHHVKDAFKLLEEREVETVFILGGAKIYEQTLHLADKMYITEIKTIVEGDSFFPEIPQDQWKETSRESHEADERNPFDYAFVTYERVL